MSAPTTDTTIVGLVRGSSGRSATVHGTAVTAVVLGLAGLGMVASMSRAIELERRMLDSRRR